MTKFIVNSLVLLTHTKACIRELWENRSPDDKKIVSVKRGKLSIKGQSGYISVNHDSDCEIPIAYADAKFVRNVMAAIEDQPVAVTITGQRVEIKFNTGCLYFWTN